MNYFPIQNIIYLRTERILLIYIELQTCSIIWRIYLLWQDDSIWSLRAQLAPCLLYVCLPCSAGELPIRVSAKVVGLCSTLAPHKHIKFGTRVPFTCHAILVLLTQERRNKKVTMICAMLVLSQRTCLGCKHQVYIYTLLFVCSVCYCNHQHYIYALFKLKMYSCLRIYRSRFTFWRRLKVL